MRKSNIHLAWVPSHSNIIGNDRADLFANAATLLEGPINPKADLKTFLPELIKRSFEIWKDKFEGIGRFKGKDYVKTMSKPFQKP